MLAGKHSVCAGKCRTVAFGECRTQNLRIFGGAFQCLEENMQVHSARFNLFGHLTVIENLMIDPMDILGKSRDEAYETGMSLLKRVGLSGRENQYPDMLSGGQKQRIAIAGAIAMRPDCIVFDEPTAMLDPKGRENVMSIIRDLNADGITCILITHFMNEAEQADRIIVLKKGKLICDRSPEALFFDREMIERAGLEMPPAIDIRDKAGLPESLTTAESIAEYIASI